MTKKNAIIRSFHFHSHGMTVHDITGIGDGDMIHGEEVAIICENPANRYPMIRINEESEAELKQLAIVLDVANGEAYARGPDGKKYTKYYDGELRSPDGDGWHFEATKVSLLDPEHQLSRVSKWVELKTAEDAAPYIGTEIVIKPDSGEDYKGELVWFAPSSMVIDLSGRLGVIWANDGGTFEIRGKPNPRKEVGEAYLQFWELLRGGLPPGRRELADWQKELRDGDLWKFIVSIALRG